MDARRTINGTLAGSVAAAVWAAQQPADKHAFGCSYDDVELLGRAVVDGDGWQLPGLAMHLGNGAAFGALYSLLRPFLPGPGAVRGLALASAEHLASWTLVGLVDRYHPRRKELVALKGNGRAFWQAWYRHALFGLVLGELERRLNPEGPDEPPEVPVSSNGHGSIELAVGATES